MLQRIVAPLQQRCEGRAATRRWHLVGPDPTSRDTCEYLRRADGLRSSLIKQRVADHAADMVSAQLGLARGNHDAARRLFGDAATKFEADGMHLLENIARWRCGGLTVGDAGAGSCSQAIAFMEREETVAPRRIIDAFAPYRGSL